MEMSHLSLLIILSLAILTSASANVEISCSNDQIVHKSSQSVDLSWEEYVDSVYGSNHDIVEKKRTNFLYKYGPVKIKAYDWDNKLPMSTLKKDWGDTYFRHSSSLHYEDNAWAEVSRYSTAYLKSLRPGIEDWIEGLSRGFPGRSPRNSTEVGYGCWFNMARGSGIFVNVGRTMVTTDKYKSTLFHDLGLTSKGCLKTDTTGANCYDRYICTAALQHGYGSVQVTGRSELVICGGGCATQPLYHTCPPVLMRSGFNASRECNCADASHLLNCGPHFDFSNTTTSVSYRNSSDSSSTGTANELVAVQHHGSSSSGDSDGYSPSPELHRHTLCVVRKPQITSTTPFNLTLLFTAGILHHLSATLPRVVRALVVYPPESTILLDIGDTGALAEHSHHTTWVRRQRQRRLDSSSTTSSSINKSSNNKIHSETYDKLRKVGYRAIGLDLGYANGGIKPSSHMDVLSINAEGFERSTLLTVSGNSLTIGVISFTSTAALRAFGIAAAATAGGGASNSGGSNSGTGSSSIERGEGALPPVEHEVPSKTVVRRIIDEAVCLRNKGAAVVILMSGGDSNVKNTLIRGTKGYVDVILGVHKHEAVSCQGNWHNAAAVGCVFAQIDSSENTMGVLSIHKDTEGGISYNSDIMTI